MHPINSQIRDLMTWATLNSESNGMDDTSNRLFRLENQHSNVLKSIQECTEEARNSNARVHNRVDKIDGDVCALRDQMSGNTEQLTAIRDGIEPLADIGSAFKLTRKIILFIAAPMAGVVAIYQSLKAFGVL